MAVSVIFFYETPVFAGRARKLAWNFSTATNVCAKNPNFLLHERRGRALCNFKCAHQVAFSS